jgi:hypothetical protein
MNAAWEAIRSTVYGGLVTSAIANYEHGVERDDNSPRPWIVGMNGSQAASYLKNLAAVDPVRRETQ